MADVIGSRASSAAGWTEFLKILLLVGVLLVVLMASIINPYLGVAALGLFIAGLIMGLNLRWGMLCLVFLLPFDPQVEVKPGFYFYFDLLFILPFLIYLWKVVFGNLRINWVSLALAPYVVFAIVSTFWRAESPFWFSAYSVRLIIAVLFMAAVAGLARMEKVTLLLGAALPLQVLYGVYQLIGRDLGSLYVLIYPHYEQQPWTDRAYGFFFQPNNFGSFCATVSIMLLGLGLRSKERSLRILCYWLAAIGFLGLACSGSRGAWLGAFAGLTLLFLFSQASFGVKIALASAIAIIILIAGSLDYEPLMRAENLDAFTVEGRSSLYLAAGLLFLQHPFIGVGLTNYQELMPSVVVWQYGAGNAAHNTYLQILSENGAIGFLLFFGPVIYLFYRNLKLAKESTAALLSSAGLAVFFVHALFDFQFTTAPQYLLLFAILFGLASKNVRVSLPRFLMKPAMLGNLANGES